MTGRRKRRFGIGNKQATCSQLQWHNTEEDNREMKALRQYDPRDGGAPHIMLHQEHITAIHNPSEQRTAGCLIRRRRFVGNWKSFNKGSLHRLSFELDCRETLQIASSVTKRGIVVPRPLISAHLPSRMLRTILDPGYLPSARLDTEVNFVDCSILVVVDSTHLGKDG